MPTTFSQDAAAVHRLLSAKETAFRLGISRATLSRLVANKKIGYYQIRNRTLFDQKHISEFLTNSEKPAKVETRRQAA